MAKVRCINRDEGQLTVVLLAEGPSSTPTDQGQDECRRPEHQDGVDGFENPTTAEEA